MESSCVVRFCILVLSKELLAQSCARFRLNRIASFTGNIIHDLLALHFLQMTLLLTQ